MIVTFDKKYLRELYCTGETSDKKHRFQPNVIRKYIDCINTMSLAKSLNVLHSVNALNCEALKADKDGIWSIRVNGKYRIEFTIKKEKSGEETVCICNILELSNHYK